MSLVGLFEIEAGHDSLARTRVVCEEKPQRNALLQILVLSPHLVRQRLDVARRGEGEVVVLGRLTNALSLGCDAELVDVGVEAAGCCRDGELGGLVGVDELAVVAALLVSMRDLDGAATSRHHRDHSSPAVAGEAVELLPDLDLFDPHASDSRMHLRRVFGRRLCGQLTSNSAESAPGIGLTLGSLACADALRHLLCHKSGVSLPICVPLGDPVCRALGELTPATVVHERNRPRNGH